MDPKGLEPLTSTMPLWRSPKLSYGPLIAWCAIHSLCGNGHPGAAYWASAAQLPDEFGLGARRCAAPGSHCPRLSATMAYCFRSALLALCALLTAHILAAGQAVVKV